MFNAKYARGKTKQNIDKYIKEYEKTHEEIVQKIESMIEKSIEERKFYVDIVCKAEHETDLSNFLKYKNFYVTNTSGFQGDTRVLTASWV